ncbi:magnesium transporter MgtE N-terminal domain-containing protein [Oceanobacillus kapialis]|uniref:MotE family protein n=1 Tax=Oceanobacillus kapialis TaxID=481353 RepID=UPI00384E0EA1
MEKDYTTEKKKMNPFLWFLFAIIFPLLIATVIAVIGFSIAGINVLDWAKEKGSNIPVVSSMIETPEEESTGQAQEKAAEQLAAKNEEIEQLNQQVQDLESTIESLEEETIRLENRNRQNQENAEMETEEEAPDTIQTIASSFKDMDSEQAALIIQDLDNQTAISILKEVSNKVRGAILEEMEPAEAATLTQLFIDANNE